MTKCAVCRGDIPDDMEASHFFSGPQDIKFSVHPSCVSSLRSKVLVLKLRIEDGDGTWLGFKVDEDCQGLLQEILDLAKNSDPGDKLYIEVDKIPLHEVLAWPDFPGW